MNPSTSRPNILVFLTDDHAQWASGAYGHPSLHTPTLDHLARTGALLRNAFTPCPVCSPARAAFHTGKFPSASGVHDYIAELGKGAAHPGIAGQSHLASLLQGQGYHTGQVGKWHLNNFRSRHPGFDVWFSNAKGTNARFGPQQFYEDHQLVSHHGHQAHFLTERALRFLRQRDAGKPFFLCIGFTNTHTPHVGEPERWTAHYRSQRDLGPPNEPLPPNLQARFPWPTDEAKAREWHCQYLAAVSCIDEQVGRILDELDSLSLAQDTLIVYTSDHGHMNGHHGLHTKGNATVPQNFFEESIRVPCILNWPGHIQPAEHDFLADHCDLFATLLEAAGTDLSILDNADQRPGRSYLGRLLGEDAAPPKPYQFAEYGNARMARSERLKLIQRYPGPNGHFPDELYDLQADPRETNNLIDDPRYSRDTESLADQLHRFFERHATEAHSGADAFRIPPHNGVEPWILDPATFPPLRDRLMF